MRRCQCECGSCDYCKRRAYHRARHSQFLRRNPGYNADYYRRHRDPEIEVREQQRVEARARNTQWTPLEDALLGTDTDRVVAATLGKTQKAVYARRARLGVVRYRKPTIRQKGGYVLVPIEPNDPLFAMVRHGRYVLEHRLVMARHLGRSLNTDEFVHHKNGIRTDNRIENLELWTRSHPDGQRVEDILQWCVEFVERYALEKKGGLFGGT